MNPEDELFLLRWNHIKLPPSVLQLSAGVGARDILWVMSASSYAALVTTPRPRAHQSTRRRCNSFLMPTPRWGKKSDGGNGLTWSPCQQVELKCCANTFNRTHAHKRKQRTPSNQGQLATSLIITLLTLPAGIENTMPLLRWCVGNENEEHLHGSRVPDPFRGAGGRRNEGTMVVWQTAAVKYFTVSAGKWM